MHRTNEQFRNYTLLINTVVGMDLQNQIKRCRGGAQSLSQSISGRVMLFTVVVIDHEDDLQIEWSSHRLNGISRFARHGNWKHQAGSRAFQASRSRRSIQHLISLKPKFVAELSS